MLTIKNKGCKDNPQEISEQLRTKVSMSLNYSYLISILAHLPGHSLLVTVFSTHTIY